jgi:hypothetical protein
VKLGAEQRPPVAVLVHTIRLAGHPFFPALEQGCDPKRGSQCEAHEPLATLGALRVSRATQTHLRLGWTWRRAEDRIRLVVEERFALVDRGWKAVLVLV